MSTTPRRMPAPGPSFVREQSLLLSATSLAGERRVRLGMSRPQALEDDWWGCFLWAADDDGLIDARDVAPRAGPPPGPPLQRLGPSFGGAMGGFLAEEDGRQCLRMSVPGPSDPERPWQQPLVVRAALKWDPLRAATMRPNELARQALEAFGRAIEACARPV
jgi:hypothetical protein